ncbi:MAG: hypothetical protein NZO58_03745 [Gemmataceae bacterium]|nr:hypothetical protein [Gemmataceae bacterium]
MTVCRNGYGKRTPFGPNTAGEVEEGEHDPLDAAGPAPDDTPGADVASGPDTAPGPDGSPAEGEAHEAAEERSSMRYRKQRRGGKGLRDIRTSERNGPVVGIASVRDGDDIVLITSHGMVHRTHVSEIRPIGRNTQGVRLMNLNEGDTIASLAKVAKDDGDDSKTAETAPAATGGDATTPSSS